MLIRLFLLVLTVFSCFILPQVPAVLHWDQVGVAYLAAHRCTTGTQFYLWVTYLGGTIGFLPILIIPTIYFFIRRRTITAIYFLVGVGLLKWSGSLLKILIARPRPPGGMLTLTTYSMPSGHAANGVLIYGILLLLLYSRIHHWAWRMLIFVICMAMILVTDLSRVYLGVHYPSDVLMGSLYAAVGLWVLQGLRRDIFTLGSVSSQRPSEYPH